MNIAHPCRAAALPMMAGFVVALSLVVSPAIVSADHHLEDASVAEQVAPEASGVEVKTAHCGCSEGYSKGGCGECNGLGKAPADASAQVGEADAGYERAPCGCMRKKAVE